MLVKQIVTCQSKNLNGPHINVQFSVVGQNGGHQLFLSREDAKKFEMGENYVVTFEGAPASNE